MPLNTHPRPIPGPALPANLRGANTQREVSDAIAMINIGNMFGAVGGIPGLQNINGWRVDRQNAPANEVNISVQRNGVPAPSTAASIFVDDRFNLPPPAHGDVAAQQVHNARVRELERTVRRGLLESFASTAAPAAAQNPNQRVITRFEVTGDFSN